MKKVKLGEVATFINGYAFKPQDWSTEGKEIIRIQNLTKTSKEINYYSGKIDKKYIVETGDILISWSGTLGVFQWYGKTAVLNQHIFKAVFDKLDINKSYFKYVVEKGLQDAVKNTHGSTMKHLTKKYFDNIIVSYTSLKEQQKISRKLDLLSELISMRQEQLEELNLLVKSRFNEMFGDDSSFEKVLLSSVCDVRDGTHDSPKYVKKGFPLITSKNVTNGVIDFNNTNYISQLDFEKINQRSKVDYGDILLPMIGTIGNPVVVDTRRMFAIKNVALIKFYNESTVHNIYIKNLLTSFYFDKQVLQKIRGGTQKFIALRDIRGFQIPLPPLYLQNEFADFVAQVDKSQFACQKAIKLWRNSLKSSII